MIHTEARTCFSRSKRYNGMCFFRNQLNNCKIVCKHEAFTTGKCTHGTCYCSKKCGTSGGHPSLRPPLHPPPSHPPRLDGGNEEGGGGGDEDAPPKH
ncbi:hypothetical protein PHJA_001310800 [Phtheirospermum japonicum]|uniref:Knottins-like domain-containing protein n=1 Tax=Phtheirospermum japonicum TaxID=374723 RepID=A0A830C3E6_9LAMI|nr:hypothetical protein PHJA_001310800 [Phtheirospermum japonicum]